MNLGMRLAAVVLSSALALSLPACSADPFVGTWVLNEAQTKAAQPKGAPSAALEGAIITIRDARGGKYTATTEGMTAGTKIQTELTFAFDGKDYTPVINPAPADTSEVVQAFERVDARTYKSIVKLGGQPVMTNLVAVSADGKTMTATMTWVGQFANALGVVAVFDKK